MNPRIVYLHGFASGPQSRKAQFFREKLSVLGLPLETPALDEGKFSQLTITGQLHYLECHIGDDPVALIGSSLGGYLAALYAARHQQVQRSVLLAPAFGFRQLWEAKLGVERLADWKTSGSITAFHYGEGRELPLWYQFIEDAARFEPFPDMRQPALIFHGSEDSVVPIEQSIAFVGLHGEARIHRMNSGHELTDVLEEMWPEIERFLSEFFQGS